MKHEHTMQEVAQAASAPLASIPPAAVAASTFLGYSPSEWLTYLTIAWVVIQMAAFAYDRIKKLHSDSSEA